MAKVCMVPISIPLLQLIMTTGYEGHFRCIKGLPEGAQPIDSFYTGNPPIAHLIFYHESFDDIEIDDERPIIIPKFERIE